MSFAFETITNLESIDALRESVDLECKLAQGSDSKGKLPKDFWPTYSSMANTYGGIILLGVQEQRGRFKAVGISNTTQLRKELVDLLANNQKVSINLLQDSNIKEVIIDGKAIVAVLIPRATRKQRPVFINGNPLTGSYIRLDEADQKMPEDGIKLLLSEQSQESLDYNVLPNFGMEDLSLPTLQAYRQRHATPPSILDIIGQN